MIKKIDYSLPYSERFTSICILPQHKKACLKLLLLLPKKVLKKIEKNRLSVTDLFDASSDPNKHIEKETLGIFKEGSRCIYLTRKNIFSEEALIGLICHEVAHAYIDFLNPLKKSFSKNIYKLKFKLQTKNIQKRYFYYDEKEKWNEYYADSLVKKWGLSFYQETLWKEMNNRGQDINKI